MIELTKRETQTLILSLSAALEKERGAIERLSQEISDQKFFREAVATRQRLVTDLERLRRKLCSGG